MNKTGYPVEWKGQTYFLSDMSAGVKDDFCIWAFNDMLATARKYMPAAEFISYRDTLVAKPPKWTTLPDECIAAKLVDAENPEPNLQLTRLLFGFSKEEMSDTDLKELMQSKSADPASDYTLARMQIGEKSDPKV